MITLYLSGPMTGLLNLNRPAFFRAERELRQLGYDIVNPARVHGPDTWDWSDYVRADLLAMLSFCSGVATLPHWEQSKGANLEVLVAGRLGWPVQSVDAWITAALFEREVVHG